MHNNMADRAINFLAALFTLIVAFPLILIIAAAIKTESKGAILYKQKRAGKNGKVFVLYKFRTMEQNSTKCEIITINDKRISRVGRFLRKSGLDEFPQLWNILIGDMNFIGPRPDMVGLHKRFSKKIKGWNKRLVVKPGITGLAQLSGASSTNPQEKLRYDLLYIKNKNLSLDLRIVLGTLRHILRLENLKI